MIIRTKKPSSLTMLAKHLGIHKQLIIDCNLDKIIDEKIGSATQLNIPYTQQLVNIENRYIELVNDHSFIKQDIFQHDTILTTNRPYDSKKFMKDIEKLLILYPFVKKEVIGQSVLGTPIIELTIGTGSKHVHMNGSFHANEWITTNMTMHWLREYLSALVEGHSYNAYDCFSFYKETTLSIVPMVNPDGVDLVQNGLPDNITYQTSILEINNHSHDFSQWKANIRGIDLNNQYPVNWEIEKERKIPQKPAPRDYPGDAPLTEPESVALSELVKKRDFDRVLAFHTQGEEIYWGYLRKEPDEAAYIVKEFEKVTGYKAVRDIDSHAGFRDWFVNDWGKAGFTIELGFGENPLPFTQFNEIYSKSKGIFFAALYM